MEEAIYKAVDNKSNLELGKILKLRKV